VRGKTAWKKRQIEGVIATTQFPCGGRTAQMGCFLTGYRKRTPFRSVLNIMQTKSKKSSPKARSSVKKPSTSVWQKIDDLIAEIPQKEWSKLPTDGAKNVDHYLYGTPKQ
jgi:hypothetical protein